MLEKEILTKRLKEYNSLEKSELIDNLLFIEELLDDLDFMPNWYDRDNLFEKWKERKITLTELVLEYQVLKTKTGEDFQQQMEEMFKNLKNKENG